MSRYVKEMMMSQLRQDFGDTKSLLILDLKGLDAMSEYQFRRDLRKKSIHVRTLKNNLAAKVFEDLGIHGLDRFLTGPSVAVWGGDGATRCTDSYVITKKGAHSLINYIDNLKKKIDMPIDWFLNSAARSTLLKVYWAEPTIITQGSELGLFNVSYNL